MSLVVLWMALHPPLLLRGGTEGISDRPEEGPGSGWSHVLEFVLEIFEQLPFTLPKAADVALDRTVLDRKSVV